MTEFNVGERITGVFYIDDPRPVHEDMALFDALPERLRAALRDYPGNIETESVWQMVQDGLHVSDIEALLRASAEEVMALAYQDKGFPS